MRLNTARSLKNVIIAFGKRELKSFGGGDIFLLSLICNYVISARWGFLSLLLIGGGCGISLWHSRGLPCNNRQNALKLYFNFSKSILSQCFYK